jgi:2,3-bisphosphoglycerate-independent phosphoglycerate mutase
MPPAGPTDVWDAPDDADDLDAAERAEAAGHTRGRRVLVIPDGLAERPGPGGTTLSSVNPMALNAVARRGAVRRVATTPAGLLPGSETGLPTLLGWAPTGIVSRGRVDAAAHGLDVPPGAVVHRVDVRHADGRPWPELAPTGLTLLGGLDEDLHAQGLADHRLLVWGHRTPTLPRRLDLDDLGWANDVAGTHDPDDLPRFQLWPDGIEPPPVLDEDTVVVCAPRSTMAGVARLMGAATVHPAGATGRPGTDIAAKARAAVGLLRDGIHTVVVHVGSPDEAAHARDPQAKRLEVQRLDRDLVAPLAAVVLDLGATLAVCPDHGTDPRTGEHLADPVPAVLWGPGVRPSGPDRVTEEAVASAPVVTSPWQA